MSDAKNTKTAPAAPKAPTAPAAKPKAKDPNATPKSFGVNLNDGPAGNKVAVIATVRKDGSWGVQANHLAKQEDGKFKNTSGARSVHQTMEAAKAALDELVKSFMDLGWQRRSFGGGGGLKPRVDAFTVNNLPKPVAKQ